MTQSDSATIPATAVERIVSRVIAGLLFTVFGAACLYFLRGAEWPPAAGSFTLAAVAWGGAKPRQVIQLAHVVAKALRFREFPDRDPNQFAKLPSGDAREGGEESS